MQKGINRNKMIQHIGICDFCNQQMEISEQNKTMFQAKLQILRLRDHNFNDDFFGDNWMNRGKSAAYLSLPKVTNNFNLAFCSKQCLLDYLAEKMNDDGLIKLTEDEIQMYAEEQE
ncbi:MAG: hypothetical protein AABY22_34435, partial [Nanoarchaeota archaeon]